jgi:hypothetical protein
METATTMSDRLRVVILTEAEIIRLFGRSDQESIAPMGPCSNSFFVTVIGSRPRSP